MSLAAPEKGIVRPPSRLLALAEFPRALAEFGRFSLTARSLLARAPRGDGHPVLVLPGFMTGDGSMLVMRRFLGRLGYDARPWELGRNLGPDVIGEDGEKLISRFRAIHRETGQKVSMVGWSLGGVMARLAANRAPEAVRQVITLGAPFNGSPRATNVVWLYETVTGLDVDGLETLSQLRESGLPLAVPSTAIYSRSDGIVAWQNCRDTATARAENIEVRGSHCGLVVNPRVLHAVADRLAQPEGKWTPFTWSDRSSPFNPEGGAERHEPAGPQFPDRRAVTDPYPRG